MDRLLVQSRKVHTIDETELQLGLSWLLKLRWGAVAGQLTALLLAGAIPSLALAYAPLLGLVAFTALTNLGLTLWGRASAPTWRLPLVLAIDVVVLSGMLAASGGASNPFTVFFLVHVALASLLLEARLAAAVVALTVLGFAALFVLPTDHHASHDHGQWSAHLVGMWIAYVLSAAFVAYFVGRVSRAIRERDRRLAEIAQMAAPNERLAALSAFSANAAHELGSPLATIRLAAQELVLAIQREAPHSSLLDDAELICREAARCRAILAELSARAGESMGEMPISTTPGRVVDELQRMTPEPLRAHLIVSYGNETTSQSNIVVPLKTLAQLLHNLVRNAFDAQEQNGSSDPVELHIEAAPRLCFQVRDRGPGLVLDIQARLGEPFVTTKADTGGLGLGVYLAQAYVERTGGHLLFQARAGGGCEVELCLSTNAITELV